jgi:DNA topoisomerase I
MTTTSQTAASRPAPQSLEAARAAGLRYVTDAIPGIRRQRAGAGFRYVGPEGGAVKDVETLGRIRALVIPPAWADVWICPLEHGHLQVTARDARGRKQYRYHQRWRAVRDETKFDKLAAFGRALPRIRTGIAADLDLSGLPRAKVLASVVRLMDAAFLRVGNEKYLRDNGSFGASTLRNEHLRVRGDAIRLSFRGKSGKHHRVELSDARLARVLRRCRDLPGYELFQYLDEGGEKRSIDAADVNDYVRAVAGASYTAKDFRTWAGTVLAAMALNHCGAFRSLVEAKRNVASGVRAVAEMLGNTPSVCRKCYIHPRVIDAYLDGTLGRVIGRRHHRTAADRALRAEERAVLRLLERTNGVPPRRRNRSAPRRLYVRGPAGQPAVTP